MHIKRNNLEFYFFFLKKTLKMLIPSKVPIVSARKSYQSPVRMGTRYSCMISVIPPYMMLMMAANTKVLIR